MNPARFSKCALILVLGLFSAAAVLEAKTQPYTAQQVRENNEPMAAITNGINMAHEGKYPDLQTIPAGRKWSESFWIRATGF
jgi:hypothetical protein